MLAGVQSFNEGVAKAVDKYCLEHSNPLPSCLDEHKAWTAETFEFPERMSSSLQAQLFIFMASDRRARRILDVGTFSGYSALAWLQGMKDTGGQVWTLENDPKMVEASKAAIAKHDKERRVHLIPGAAIET
jgi:predicted O-methyltransferase YrrM